MQPRTVADYALLIRAALDEVIVDLEEVETEGPEGVRSYLGQIIELVNEMEATFKEEPAGP